MLLGGFIQKLKEDPTLVLWMNPFMKRELTFEHPNTSNCTDVKPILDEVLIRMSVINWLLASVQNDLFNVKARSTNFISELDPRQPQK